MIQGHNVTITINGASGPELVGEFQEMEFSLKNETEDYLELGDRIAKILDGEIKIDGKLKRGLLNLNIIKSCFGSSSIKRGIAAPVSPRFTIAANINAPALGISGKYKFINAVIPELGVNIGKGVVKTDYSFKCEGIEEV